MRLAEDSSSYRCSGIIRRDFRHDPGLPETEVPRHRALRRNKKKHVHDYKSVVLRSYKTERQYRILALRKFGPYSATEYVTQYICEGCGNRKTHRPWR